METSFSLLERLQQSPADEAAWRRLDAIYRPFLTRILRTDPTLGPEAEDVTQEILAVVHRELPGFTRERPGSFRRWLRTLAGYRLKEYYRARRKHAAGPLTDLADDRSELARRWDDEHNNHVLGRLLDLVDGEFSQVHVRAFRGVFFEERKADEVAAELGVSVGVVYLAKSRILKWLREVGRGMLD